MSIINNVVANIPPYYNTVVVNENMALEILSKHIKKGLKVHSYFEALSGLETENIDLGEGYAKKPFPFDIYKTRGKQYYKTSPAFLCFVNYSISVPVYKLLEALDGQYEFVLNFKKDCYEYRLKT